MRHDRWSCEVECRFGLHSDKPSGSRCVRCIYGSRPIQRSGKPSLHLGSSTLNDSCRLSSASYVLSILLPPIALYLMKLTSSKKRPSLLAFA